MRHFDVVGDVMGVGQGLGLQLPHGAMPMGLNPGALQAIAATLQQQRQPNVIAIPPAPDWRSGQLAPGVMQPDEGLVPIPLTPQQAGGIFAAATPNIEFRGTLQKPFRAERFLIQTVKTGASATSNFVIGQIFVGTDLQQADLGNLPLELLGAGNSFGTRLTLMQAPPGVLIRLQCTTVTALAGADTIAVSMMFLGRIVH